MAILDILRLGHPVLREEARDLTADEILSADMKAMVASLWQTVQHADGLGLAAPQVGESLKLCVIEVPSNNPRYREGEQSDKYVLFNPSIKCLTDETISIYEGCLSVPGLRGLVPRCQKIEVTYLDSEAKQQVIIAEDLLAIVFQHEIDHLYGKLYVDRMIDMSTLSFETEHQQFHLS